MDPEEKKKFIQELGIPESLFDEMLADCVEEIRAAFLELRSAYAGGDLGTMKSKSHLIKGTAGNFRLQGVYLAAMALNDHLKKDEIDTVRLPAMIDRIAGEIENL